MSLFVPEMMTRSWFVTLSGSRPCVANARPKLVNTSRAMLRVGTRSARSMCPRPRSRPPSWRRRERGLGGRSGVGKGVDVLLALLVQADFDDGLQAVALRLGQHLRLQQRHLPGDQAQLMQAAHAAQAGGWRSVHGGGQVLVAAAGVLLQFTQQGAVQGVEREGVLHESSKYCSYIIENFTVLMW